MISNIDGMTAHGQDSLSQRFLARNGLQTTFFYHVPTSEHLDNLFGPRQWLLIALVVIDSALRTGAVQEYFPHPRRLTMLRSSYFHALYIF